LDRFSADSGLRIWYSNGQKAKRRILDLCVRRWVTWLITTIQETPYSYDKSNLLKRLGFIYTVYSKYDAARINLENALSIDISNKDEVGIFKSRMFLSDLYLKNSFFGKAHNNIEKSLKLSKKLYGINSPETAKIYNFKGNLKYIRGEYEDAGKLFIEALKINENGFCSNDFDIIKNVIDLSMFYLYDDNYILSLLLNNKAKNMATKAFSNSGVLMAEITHSRSELLFNQGKIQEAKLLALQAMKLNSIFFGKNSQNYYMSILFLGLINLEQGQYMAATELISKEKIIAASYAHKDHLDTANLSLFASLIFIRHLS